MQYNLDHLLRDINGSYLEGGKTRLDGIISQALLANLPEDSSETLEKKMRRWEIHKAIQKEPKNVTLSSEDVTTIKERVAKCFTLLVVGQVVDHLENVK